MNDMPVIERTRADSLATKPRRRSRIGMALLFALLIGGIVYAVFFWPKAAPDAAKKNRPDAIPVLASAARTQDVPIYLDGLGTVQAFNTVTIKAQVSGALTDVRFAEGQMVKAGDVLAQIDARPYQATLDQNVAKKAQDEATLANARLDLVRYQKLASTAYTSAQTADTQKATVAQDEAIVRQDQALIDSARTQLSFTTITAPIDGRTGLRTVDKGNIVASADATGLTVITQLQPISVVFTLPQQQLADVAAAMKAGAAEVIARNQQGGAQVLDRGVLSVLDNQVDSTTGTIKLKARFPNTDSTLWPGGFVGVQLHIRTDKGVVTVPPSSIQRGPRGAYVYIVKDDNTVERRDVTVGHEDDQASVVTAGVKEGERVVTDGASRLTDGTKVSVTAPQADAPPGGSGPSAPGTSGRKRHGSGS